MQDLTDLIDQCIEGDRKAQRALYEYLKGRLMGICRRYNPSQEDSNDIFQESMVRLFKNLDKAREASDFDAWTSRIAINVSIDAYKRRKKNEMVALEESEVWEFSADDLSALEQMKAEDIVTLLHELPENQMVTFNMFIDGYSHKEIAGELKIAESTSRTLLTRAKKRMVVLLSKRELGESAYGQ